MSIQDLKTSLDLKQDLNIYLKCKQFDNLNLILSIFDNSLQADLSNYDVRLRAMKADNVPLIQEHIGITKNGNIVNIQADVQLTTTAGNTPIELQFIDKSTGEKKATFNLVLVVVASAIAIEASISKATYTLLEELENKIDQCSDFFENIDTAINLDNELKSTISSANTSKVNLDNSISTGNTVKTNLDNTISTGNKLKTNLENDISTGNTLKGDLEETITTGDNLLNSLENFENQHVDVSDISNKLANVNTQLSDIEQQKSDKQDLEAINAIVTNHTTEISENVQQINNLQRIKADTTYVNNQIQNMNTIVQGFYSTVSSLTSAFPSGNGNNYVVLADNNVYRWTGTSWVTTGYIWGSAGIAPGSVKISTLNQETLNVLNARDIIQKIQYDYDGYSANVLTQANDYTYVAASFDLSTIASSLQNGDEISAIFDLLTNDINIKDFGMKIFATDDANRSFSGVAEFISNGSLVYKTENHFNGVNNVGYNNAHRYITFCIAVLQNDRAKLSNFNFRNVHLYIGGYEAPMVTDFAPILAQSSSFCNHVLNLGDELINKVNSNLLINAINEMHDLEHYHIKGNTTDIDEIGKYQLFMYFIYDTKGLNLNNDACKIIYKALAMDGNIANFSSKIYFTNDLGNLLAQGYSDQKIVKAKQNEITEYDLTMTDRPYMTGNRYIVVFTGALCKYPLMDREFLMSIPELYVGNIKIPFISADNWTFKADTLCKPNLHKDYLKNPLFNLTWNALGDSITQGVGTTIQYHKYLGNELGIKVNNYGIGGTTIGGGTRDGYGRCMADRYVDMVDADIITVFGGVNDFMFTNTPMGTITDTDYSTFLGALNVLIKGLLNKYIGKRIGFITPMHNNDNTNSEGLKEIDYVNAIKERCSYYGIPILDLYSGSGINPQLSSNVTALIPDKLHPNDVGHRILANKIRAFILSL